MKKFKTICIAIVIVLTTWALIPMILGLNTVQSEYKSQTPEAQLNFDNHHLKDCHFERELAKAKILDDQMGVLKELIGEDAYNALDWNDLHRKSTMECPTDEGAIDNPQIVEVRGERTLQHKGEAFHASPDKIYTKKDIGEDVQSKIRQLQEICYSKDMNEEQVLWTLALVDHESGGSYDENVVGDYGNSHGIGQWHAPSGRYAPPTYEEQAHKICDEMKTKYDEYPILTAITKHNCPACWERWVYINKVKAAKENFF
jgi:hypothetical protein